MKFINYLTDISGIEIFPLISLFIFFSFFIVLSIWAFSVKKVDLLEMKNIPLDSHKDSNI